MPGELWDGTIYLFLGAAVEVWERISKLIPHFMLDVIAYHHCD